MSLKRRGSYLNTWCVHPLSGVSRSLTLAHAPQNDDERAERLSELAAELRFRNQCLEHDIEKWQSAFDSYDMADWGKLAKFFFLSGFFLRLCRCRWFFLGPLARPSSSHRGANDGI